MSVFVDNVGLNITLWVWDTTRHIFDIFCIKVSVGVLAVDDLKNPQNEKKYRSKQNSEQSYLCAGTKPCIQSR